MMAADSGDRVRVAVLVLRVTPKSYRVTDTGSEADAVWICRHETDTALDTEDVGRFLWLTVYRETAESLGLCEQ